VRQTKSETETGSFSIIVWDRSRTFSPCNCSNKEPAINCKYVLLPNNRVERLRHFGEWLEGISWIWLYINETLLRFSVHSSASGGSFNYAPALTMTGEFSWCIWMAMSLIRSCILTTLPPSILFNKQTFSSILKIEWPLSNSDILLFDPFITPSSIKFHYRDLRVRLFSRNHFPVFVCH